MQNYFNTSYQIISQYGISWTLKRAWYEAQVRSGIHKIRFRKRQWSPQELSRWLAPDISADPPAYATYWKQNRQPFFFAPADKFKYAKHLGSILGEKGCTSLINDADNVCTGIFQYFFAQKAKLGFPPDWHYNPITGQCTLPSAHWSRIPVFSSATGDIKFIWEPGRFASAYTLARSYWLTGDEKYAETFWLLIESFHQSNPPNQGAHWKCGQEISLRLMAWCFALYAFADAPATTPERLSLIIGMIAAQANRVAGDHIYAYLQRNNHAISEGVGLWSVGLLFPEFKKAEKWRRLGRKFLEFEAKRQIYEDGSFVQQSSNYHRLMLHDYLWAIRLGEISNFPLSHELISRVRKSLEFLYQQQDDGCGFTPNYGSNDGALILPINQCDYRDFRPVLGAAHYLFYQRRIFNCGMWDEDLLWLFGPKAKESAIEKVQKKSFAAATGGYYTLRGTRSWGMIRCGTPPHRPPNPDTLHLDIWRDGVNVACDPGTYLYYAHPPWNNTLGATRFHNTVTVNGLDQSERGPRFLRLNWHRANARHILNGTNLFYFEGEQNGYERLPNPVIHRRAVVLAGADTWIVVDDLLGTGSYDFTLHWLLADLPFSVNKKELQVSLDTKDDNYLLQLRCVNKDVKNIMFDVVRGTDKSNPRGWQSLYYGMRQPALSAILNVQSSAPCRLISLFSPQPSSAFLKTSDEYLIWKSGDLNLEIKLLKPGDISIVTHINMQCNSISERIDVVRKDALNTI